MSSSKAPSSSSGGKAKSSDDGMSGLFSGLKGRLTDQKVMKAVMGKDSSANDTTPAVTKIEFHSVHADAKPGEYGSAEDPSPYVSVAQPERDQLLKPDEVVSSKPMRIHFAYPLTNKHTVTLDKSDITRKELVAFITKHYQQVYAEEARTTTVQRDRMPGMLNRNRTDGKYGIWGHDIEDLLLNHVEWNKQEKVWRLSIDS